MTNHAVLAGSVLAGVALWATLYAVLPPNPAPGTRDGRTAASAPFRDRAAADSAEDDLVEDPPGPRRWVDRPRQAAETQTVALVDPRSETDLRITGEQRYGRPANRHGLHRIGRAALSETPLAHRMIRQRAALSRPFRARGRFRRFQEPIQFSLATRSSS